MPQVIDVPVNTGEVRQNSDDILLAENDISQNTNPKNRLVIISRNHELNAMFFSDGIESDKLSLDNWLDEIQANSLNEVLFTLTNPCDGHNVDKTEFNKFKEILDGTAFSNSMISAIDFEKTDLIASSCDDIITSSAELKKIASQDNDFSVSDFTFDTDYKDKNAEPRNSYDFSFINVEIKEQNAIQSLDPLPNEIEESKEEDVESIHSNENLVSTTPKTVDKDLVYHYEERLQRISLNDNEPDQLPLAIDSKKMMRLSESLKDFARHSGDNLINDEDLHRPLMSFESEDNSIKKHMDYETLTMLKDHKPSENEKEKDNCCNIL